MLMEKRKKTWRLPAHAIVAGDSFGIWVGWKVAISVDNKLIHRIETVRCSLKLVEVRAWQASTLKRKKIWKPPIHAIMAGYLGWRTASQETWSSLFACRIVTLCWRCCREWQLITRPWKIGLGSLWRSCVLLLRRLLLDTPIKMGIFRLERHAMKGIHLRYVTGMLAT